MEGMSQNLKFWTQMPSTIIAIGMSSLRLVSRLFIFTVDSPPLSTQKTRKTHRTPMFASPRTTEGPKPLHYTSFLSSGSLTPGPGQRASNRCLRCPPMGTASPPNIIHWELTTYTAFLPHPPSTPETPRLSTTLILWNRS